MLTADLAQAQKMKRILIGTLGLMVMMLSISPAANASSLLNITVGVFTSNCDNSAAFTATNCGAGFVTIANSNTISFTGAIPGYIAVIAMNGNSPGVAIAGNTFDVKSSVLHTSGTDDLVVLFGQNNFTLPAGPGLFLSASASATFGQSVVGDLSDFRSWGRADNVLAIGGTIADAPACIPGAGLTTACSALTVDVPFSRGAGNYSLLGRETIHQSTSDTLAATYSATVAANAVSTPEPTSIVLLGAGILMLAGLRRRK